MTKKHILIVEDDEDIQQLVSFNLIKAGFNVSCVESGEDAMQFLLTEKTDCLLLDLMLPGINGLDLCARIRQDSDHATLPIVMLTALGEETDVVTGLNTGADDYIKKPFSPKVLVARIQSVLRRNRASGHPDNNLTISIHGLNIDQGRHEARLNGRLLALTMTEFAILALLAARPGWVYSRQQIVDAVRGHGYMVTLRAMDVQIYGLRKKMAKEGQYIETVRGVGYRFKE